MKENNIPGKVLLLDSGDGYYPVDNVDKRLSNEQKPPTYPHPKMWYWFENWSKLSVIHDTVGVGYFPVPASSHIGVGGGGAHDTRITFMPTSSQAQKYKDAMNWSDSQYFHFMQTALNMIPLQSARNESESVSLYDTILSTWDRHGVLKRVKDDEFKAQIVHDSAAYVSIAMFPDETRWSSAYLLDNAIRPSNLDVITNWHANKIIFNEKKEAIAVESSKGNVVKADEFLITAGSLGTPAILQRSGIGPKSVLEKLGIKQILYNDEIGHGVDHTEIAVTYNSLAKWQDKSGNQPRLIN